MTALVIAAHPDDEVLGAGATIAMLAAAGEAVHILILAEGVSLRRGWTLATSQERCREAASVLGATSVSFGGFGGDALMADIPSKAVVAVVERSLAASRPQLVLTHYRGDVHADHRRVAESVVYATRLLGSGPVREVLHFEVPSSTEQQTDGPTAFHPTSYVDVGVHLATKCAALAVYGDECFAPPHPRSEHGVRTAAAWRGMQAGVRAAEAFVSGRRLVSELAGLVGVPT